MLLLDNVQKVYGKKKEKKVEALKGINLSVNKGEIFGVVGFSGAGKSTLIRCVNLLERPTSGKVFINGVDLLALSPKELREQRKENRDDISALQPLTLQNNLPKCSDAADFGWQTQKVH